MKIKISFAVDIDADAWQLNYGTDAHDIRADVQAYVKNGVITQFEGLGLLKEDIE